jgi:hypothetical protein
MMMKWLKPHQQGVLVALDRSDVDYLVNEMLTDGIRMGRTNSPGAATVVRKIVVEAIARHKNEARALKARIAAGGVDRSRLMAGR